MPRPSRSPALALLALPVLGCAPEDSSFGSAPPASTDLLMVVLDTTNEPLMRAFMPEATAWVDGARSFSVAVSPSNSTVESTASLFQGRWAQRQTPLGAEAAILPQAMADLGYTTVLSSANEVLAMPWFEDGFDSSWVTREADGDPFPDRTAMEEFLAAWAAAPSPKFGWLQLVAGHDYRSSNRNWLTGGWARTDEELTEAWAAWGQDAAETDALLPSVFAANEGGLTILSSDHGELFGNRGSFLLPGIAPHGHGQSTSAGETHVPLALRGPGVASGRIDAAVSTLEIHDTFLSAAAGLDARNDLRASATGARLAATSTCFTAESRDATRWMASVSLVDGTQWVHSAPTNGLPEWLRWDDDGAPGLSTAWAAVGGDEVPAEVRTLLEGDAHPNCIDDQSACADEALASLGYVDCR